MNSTTILLVTSGGITGGYINYLFNKTYYDLIYGYYPYGFENSIFNFGFVVGSSIGFTVSRFISDVK
tara:strand:+ start:1330 stop:1530 length:201 start_codon:yes stop_codon:yes gene_type:complete